MLELAELPAAVRSLWAGKFFESPPSWQGLSGPVYGELRRSGRFLGADWESNVDWWSSLVKLLHTLRPLAIDANELVLCFGGQPQRVGEAHWKRMVANHRRGLYGYELLHSGRVFRAAPVNLIAQNRSVQHILSGFADQQGLKLQESGSDGINLFEFEAQQYWIDLCNGVAIRLFRGNRLVQLTEIRRPAVDELASLLRRYLVRSVARNGRMTYLYYPSRGTESTNRNNSIRQWMATRALIQAWRRSQDEKLLATLRSNLAHNLRMMYAEDAGFGLIVDGVKVKLGAIALAALALSECPFASEFANIRQRLLATITFLWQDSGQFRTFYRPGGCMDCQNFYPGEALLLWSTLMATSDDASIAERFWRSFAYYQRWHLANRNPAFIPWHTQAQWNVWKLTRDVRLSQAIFEMNDWLLDVQQWETAPQLDCQGRFYDPSRPFGPPHASSTAVYLEGLVDAFALAKELGDVERAENYRIAILRGLRSIAQLTFKDDCDMFYVAKRDRLRGGVKTTEYDNVVRIDNVQHSLAAIHKVLAVFSDDDFSDRLRTESAA